jgi:CcmD family protein
MKKMLLFLNAFLLSTVTLLAQEQVEMADNLRNEGKIYVVVAVVSIVLLGVLFYVIRLDRKVSVLEKELSQK